MIGSHKFLWEKQEGQGAYLKPKYVMLGFKRKIKKDEEKCGRDSRIKKIVFGN